MKINDDSPQTISRSHEADCRRPDRPGRRQGIADRSAEANTVVVAPQLELGHRGPGRPPGKQGRISRVSILRLSYKLVRTVPLQELSVVVVAKALRVTPALIHYYTGGRDRLTSGTMNLFYRDLLRNMPDSTDDWAFDLLATARAIYAHLVTYAGVASYVVSRNRFRVFQMTSGGERDYGAEVLERLACCVRRAGCSAERTGIYAHLIMEFLISSAHGAVR
ncbi:MAG TPA: hypothetical protein VMM15_05495, partial [Bradyrhizobium sp.]|nr:hypothetical protein [Bradyrhizobium sp.]